MKRTDEAALKRVRNLEESLETAWAAIEKLRAQEPTRIGSGYHADLARAGDPELWLPDQHVTFFLPDRRRERDAWIQVHFAPDEAARLRVYASDVLDVHPRASNVVHLGVVER
jgi:hypothetical protein